MARAVAICAVMGVLAVMVVLAAVLAPLVAAARAPAMAPAPAPSWTSAEADQKCDVGKLVVCASAIILGRTPSKDCCSNLKAQEVCFCQYAKNRAYSHYINSPNARKTIESCGITLPTCSK